MKLALSGATGQLGSFIIEKALSLDYEVFGLKRRSSSYNSTRIDHLFDHPNLHLVYGDITDYASIASFIGTVKPDIYVNAGAQSHVQISFLNPISSMEATGNSVLYALEAIRQYSPQTKFITLSSSEMFGSTPPPQSETSPFHPRSVYACAKLFGYNTTVHYREMGLFASNAICFNFESCRRGENFLTRKVSLGATRIKMGLQKELVLGNLHSKRSFNHAKDIVDALFLMARHNEPDDFIVGHNPMVLIKDFVIKVFERLDLNWEDYVRIDPKYFRATEVDALEPDASKIKEKLSWSPKYSVNDIIDEMIESDLKLAKNEVLLKQASADVG